MDKIIEVIKKYEKDYRPLPFWSWNDKLEEETLRSQIRQMHAQGLGGFFMHARGGLETEYMSDDWFNCISACIDEAEKLGMQAWCYDENGWPSGFADGKLPLIGYEHHIKWIEYRTVVSPSDKVLYTGEVNEETYYIVLCSNQYYVDTLSEHTLQKFVQMTHEKYYEKFSDAFGKTMPGFFTDEPQYKLDCAPWSLDFAEEFKTEYGYDVLPRLSALFKETNGCEKVRNDYWKLVAKRFRIAGSKQIGDWCAEHNAALTGHVMREDDLTNQIQATGGAMGYYEHMQMPGIDWLTRSIASPVIPKQLGSVCAQLGRDKAISETFALCGWDVSFNELKWVAEWQFVNGVNMLCQHLEGYSLRGFRKRDYPASLFIQQPWWENYHLFNRYFSRLGALLGKGEDISDVLLLHPMNSMYVAYTVGRNEKTERLDHSFIDTANTLSGMQIAYHFGDEYLMSKYGSVEDNELVIGNCRYKTVVLPYILNMSAPVLSLLCKFKENGGKIYKLYKCEPLLEGECSEQLNRFINGIPLVTVEQLSNVTAGDIRMTFEEDGNICQDINVTVRMLDGEKIWFAVNLNRNTAHNVKVKVPADADYRTLDLNTMKYTPIEATKDGLVLDFLPAQSYLITRGNAESDNRTIQEIQLPDKFDIIKCDKNALTLDSCEYRIDGGKWQDEIPVIKLQNLLTEQRADCIVEMKFHFEAVTKMSSNKPLQLAVECLEQCKITVNENIIANSCKGKFIDSSFELVDISDAVTNGDNELIIERRFVQRQKVYDVLYGKDVLETERNKLTYDTELESVYIVGDFGVYSKSVYSKSERNALITEGPFVIKEQPKTVKIGSITEQGFAFFAGKIKLGYLLDLKKDEACKYVFRDNNLRAVTASVSVNGMKCGDLIFAPFCCDLTEAIKDGENQIEITLYSGNRNLLGPHHNRDGESYAVSPGSFLCDENYRGNTTCLVSFGVNCQK